MCECVAQVMYEKVADQHRLSPFGMGLLRFLLVAAPVHPFDDALLKVTSFPAQTDDFIHTAVGA